MGSERFEFSEVSNSQTNLTMVPGERTKRCQVSLVMGFILLLLAVILAVGVGIIVHFAGGDREVICKCDQSQTPDVTAEAIRNQCIIWALEGNSDICNRCTSSSTTTATTMSVTSTSTLAPTTTSPPKVTDVRLPDSVRPVHYNVELQTYMTAPNPANFTFKGSVKIWLYCEKATDNITLHINLLTVNPASIKFQALSPGDQPTYHHSEEDKQRQFYIIKLSANMKPGENYTVDMEFTSPLQTNLNGLYLSQYTRGNETIYLATTQFQPTDARKAFPCFDEPAIKATFNITLVRPIERISISNMPIIDNSTHFQENGITWVKDVYEQTPKMSTYLLAFVICDFQYTYNFTKRHTLYRAWATPESVTQTDYALAVGIAVLEHFEDFFEIDFPLPKQDMIAIPDFAAGAMENWGLITYRETAMLYEPGVSNEMNKERVAVVVSHELAHQWFGDLVTPSWWDDLWLNEGFASFVEYMGVDFVHPDWMMFDKFVISDLQSAFDFDGLISSHPVYVPVAHPDEINEIFDTISYAKGASIIRMMRHFLGFDTFKRGMTEYLRSKAYAAAFHDDLWNSLTVQAGQEGKEINVKAVMDTWALQMNYPVVTVTRDFGQPARVSVTQERYLSDPTAPDPGKYVSPFNYTWTIPLTFTSSKSRNFNQTNEHVLWMDRTEKSKVFDLGSDNMPELNDSNGWILANVEQNGYYRVNYQAGNWKALCQQLQTDHTVIPIINRAQIINDAWNLAKGSFLGLETALETIAYLNHERDHVPWYAARSELNYVRTMLSLTSQYGAFQSFMQGKINSTYEHFGLDNTGAGHVQVYTRSLIAGQACSYGIQSCLDQTSVLYKQWMSSPNNNPIDPNLRSVIYCYAISNGGWDEWSFALRMYRESNVASEKANILSAMSCSSKPWILNHFLGLILEDHSPIRSQDALSVVSNVASGSVGRPLAWNFFRGKYEQLKSKFGSSFFAWSNVISGVTNSFNTQFELDEVISFRKSQEGNLGSGERAFDQATEKVKSNIKWMEKNLPILDNWLPSSGHF